MIRSVSKHRAKELREYRKLRMDHLARNQVCVACGAETATEIHHSRGRIHRLLLAEEYFKAVCTWCHARIHREPKWAIAKGLLATMGQWNDPRPQQKS